MALLRTLGETLGFVERAAVIPQSEYDLSGAMVFSSTYGMGDSEPVLPTLNEFGTVAANSGPVFALISARLLLFSEAVPRLFDDESNRADKGRVESLDVPWPGGHSGELLARMLMDVDLAGNAFIARTADGGLTRLRPDWVDIVSVEHSDSKGRKWREPLGYLYSYGGDKLEPVLYDADEVAHWAPLPDPLASFRGMTWLTPVAREIRADLAMTTYQNKFYEHAATPNMIVKYAQPLGKPKRDEISDMLTARYGGIDNAYKTVVLDAGGDMTVVGSSFNDMAFTAVSAATENRLASAAGVPPIIVGFREGLQAATYSNFETGMRRFADLTMKPLWRSAASALSTVTEIPQGKRLILDASDISALRDSAKDRAETFRLKAVTAGELLRSGYKHETVADAVDAADLSKLEHTGLAPTSLYDPAAKAEGGGSGVPGGGDALQGKPKTVGGQGAAAPQPIRSKTGGCVGCGPDADESARHLAGKHEQKAHAGGKAKTTGSGTKDDPLITGDILVAQQALADGQYVEFLSPRQAGTVLSEIKKQVDEAEAAGKDKPNIDLCRASLKGTNLFCSQNKGIPRAEMPQLSGKPLPGSPADRLPKNAKGEVDLGPAFIERMRSRGVAMEETTEQASYLKASQSEIAGGKVVGIAQAMREGKIADSPIFVSRDNYVVDGHHRWAAKVAVDLDDGKIGDVSMPVRRLDADITTLLRESNEFAAEMGIPQASVFNKDGRSLPLLDVMEAVRAWLDEG
jgi:phage portal protein BeeE